MADQNGRQLGYAALAALASLGAPGTEYRYECVATFRLENGRWMLTTFRLTKDGQEVTPPGL